MRPTPIALLLIVSCAIEAAYGCSGGAVEKEPLAFEPDMVEHAEAIWELQNPVAQGHQECSADDTQESIMQRLTAMAPVALQGNAQFDELRRSMATKFSECLMFMQEQEQPPTEHLEETLHDIVDPGDFTGTHSEAELLAVGHVMRQGEHACYSEAAEHCTAYRNALCAYVREANWDSDRAIDVGRHYTEHTEQVERCEEGDYEPVTPYVPDVEIPGSNLTPDDLATLVKALDLMESQGHDLGALANNMPQSMVDALGGQDAIANYLGNRG